MLLARRLVEAGVRFVSLTAGGWDHHQNIKDSFGKTMPDVDHSVAALLSDLGNRGMLDNTLVMLTTEFGRTPKNQQRRRPRPLAPRFLSNACRRRGEERPHLRRV